MTGVRWPLALALTVGLGWPAVSSAQNVAPFWISPPHPREQDFPRLAMLLSIPGRVVVRCRAVEQGPPRDCEVGSERPDGLGFGQAAIAVAQRGRIDPGLIDGKIVPRSITTTVVFDGFPELTPSIIREWPAVNQGRLALARIVAHVIYSNAPLFDDIDDLDITLDRREQVAVWIEEARSQRAVMAERLAVVLARSYSTRQLSRMLIGRFPSDPPLAGSSSPFDWADVYPTEYVRVRYCARWDC